MTAPVEEAFRNPRQTEGSPASGDLDIDNSYDTCGDLTESFPIHSEETASMAMADR